MNDNYKPEPWDDDFGRHTLDGGLGFALPWTVAVIVALVMWGLS